MIFKESCGVWWQTLAGIDSHKVLFDLISDLHFKLQEALVREYNSCVPFVAVPRCSGSSMLPVCKVIAVFWPECVSGPGTSGH